MQPRSNDRRQLAECPGPLVTPRIANIGLASPPKPRSIHDVRLAAPCAERSPWAAIVRHSRRSSPNLLPRTPGLQLSGDGTQGDARNPSSTGPDRPHHTSCAAARCGTLGVTRRNGTSLDRTTAVATLPSMVRAIRPAPRVVIARCWRDPPWRALQQRGGPFSLACTRALATFGQTVPHCSSARDADVRRAHDHNIVSAGREFGRAVDRIQVAPIISLPSARDRYGAKPIGV